MSLRLKNVSKSVDDQIHIHSTDLELKKGSMNVLLGPTLAGKTSLMRLMAGLDKPDTGQIFWDGVDVTGMRVQARDVAMVYQQFVNYPSLSVFENIASPLRLQKKSAAEIKAKVHDMAELLKLTDLLDRKPGEISGGQQQRCAIARALAKDVGLVLMDEPLANLDYKLREELRVEIPRLFEASGGIFVYAATEPEEALLLGGSTACLWEGRVTQFGPSMEVYHQPVDETTARVYSDPPMNFMSVRKEGAKVHFPGGQIDNIGTTALQMPDGEYRAGFRAHEMEIGTDTNSALSFETEVVSTELSGSETFVHLATNDTRWIGLVHGVQRFEIGTKLRVQLDPDRMFYFGSNGNLVHGPHAQAAMVGA